MKPLKYWIFLFTHLNQRNYLGVYWTLWNFQFFSLRVHFLDVNQLQWISSNQLQALLMVGSLLHGHWSMPIYRKNGKTDAEIEIIKPEYRRLSHERNQKLFRLLNSFEHRERRVSSIWHAYTKHLFWLAYIMSTSLKLACMKYSEPFEAFLVELKIKNYNWSFIIVKYSSYQFTSTDGLLGTIVYSSYFDFRFKIMSKVNVFLLKVQG